MTGFASKRAITYNWILDWPVEDLKVSEGTVYGTKYHTVYPVGGDWHKMEEWCTQTYGAGPKAGVWTHNARWYMNNRKFWFRNEKDLTMFILRWR